MIEYRIEHILSYTDISGPVPEVIGQLPEGLRVNFYSGGGEVHGPRVKGKLKPIGGDWVTVRKDGVAHLDSRLTIETNDGALILVTSTGVVDFGEDGYERYLGGELPPVAQVRTSPRFQTAHPTYLWLTRLHCFAVGEFRPAIRTMSHEVYAIR